jgi:hypothetical protein
VRHAAWLLLLGCMLARGADDDDSAALSLPAAAAAPGNHSFSLTTEGAVTEDSQRIGGDLAAERLSLDFRYDARVTSAVRMVLADLLDLEWSRPFEGWQHINTFKEGYVSWQPRSDLLLDIGRINVRQGVALGYNPTDFFREGALRTIDSLDPGSLRQNRLGTAMLRTEALWDRGALTAIYAPRLKNEPSSRPFDPDFGATNNRSRWSLSLTQRLWRDFAPQWILLGDDHAPPQLGVNLTRVFDTSTVAYLEVSGGRHSSLWSEAQHSPDAASLRSRAATGITYSTAAKISLTVEYQYNGAALSRSGWAGAREQSGAAYGRYRDLATTRQDPVTQHNAFIYATWQDPFLRHLDLSAFLRIDLIDHSCLPWTEMRYHWSRLDAALRWQAYRGGAASDYGAAASRQTWQALVDFYL